MTGYGCRRQAHFFSPAHGDQRPRIAYLSAFAATLQFQCVYSALAAFLFNDLLDGFACSLVFELAHLTVFSLFQNLIDEFSSAQDALVEVLWLPSPSHSLHLRPAALAPDKASAG